MVPTGPEGSSSSRFAAGYSIRAVREYYAEEGKWFRVDEDRADQLVTRGTGKAFSIGPGSGVWVSSQDGHDKATTAPIDSAKRPQRGFSIRNMGPGDYIDLMSPNKIHI
jgi:hypothetical protein